jgi:hypothetical protein
MDKFCDDGVMPGLSSRTFFPSAILRPHFSDWRGSLLFPIEGKISGLSFSKVRKPGGIRLCQSRFEQVARFSFSVS